MKQTSFSNSQIQAVRHKEGPMMVLAGPGAGKTLVITNRTKYLIEEYGINPSNILVITFTKAAAMEMQERFFKLMEGKKLPVSFGTFHAVFFKILKYAYNYSSENILREDEKYKYIKEIVDYLELEYEDEKEFISSIIDEISNVKGDMINIEYYYSKNCSDTIFKKIYEKYNARLIRSNKVDFDDMLVMCYELLSKRADILQAWQNKYKYILIDEFQDINKVQYEVMKLLALPDNNIFIVGDDDQSIYRFRGARPEIMLNFEKDYEDVKRVVLSENYRSTEKIVKASLRLIANNKRRFEKNIRAVNGEGEDVCIIKCKDHIDENAKIVELIRKYMKEGYKYSDIAIISRTNIGARFVVQKLMEYNFPFKIKDTMPNIYEHWIAKNIFTYINIARGDNKRSSFLQIINKPNRYVSRDVLTESEVDLMKLERYYSDKEWMLDRICKLQYDLRMIKNMKPYAAINYISKAIGYNDYLKEYAEYRKINPQELYDIVEELKEGAKPFKTFEEWFEYIEQYSLELEKQEKNVKSETECVEIITMHGSKGLEYKIVIIVDANEGVIPHRKAMLDEDTEEERRMFYVALTRAKEHLHIYCVDEMYGKSSEVSRFVNEIYNYGNK